MKSGLFIHKYIYIVASGCLTVIPSVRPSVRPPTRVQAGKSERLRGIYSKPRANQQIIWSVDHRCNALKFKVRRSNPRILDHPNLKIETPFKGSKLPGTEPIFHILSFRKAGRRLPGRPVPPVILFILCSPNERNTSPWGIRSLSYQRGLLYIATSYDVMTLYIIVYVVRIIISGACSSCLAFMSTRLLVPCWKTSKAR